VGGESYHSNDERIYRRTFGASEIVSDSMFTLAHDLLVVGTRNGASTTAKRIVGIDGNTGATLWPTIGNAGGVATMDIISSSPAIDFVNHAAWVPSRSAGAAAQPSLWKLNPNSGAVLATAALGDTDTDPTAFDSRATSYS